MKNSDVVNDFINGIESRTKNIYSENRVLYSYGYHFPLVIRLFNGFFAVNRDNYSNTTSHHKGLVIRAIPDKKIIFLNTRQMKQVIRDKMFNEQDVIDLQNIKV